MTNIDMSTVTGVTLDGVEVTEILDEEGVSLWSSGSSPVEDCLILTVLGSLVPYSGGYGYDIGGEAISIASDSEIFTHTGDLSYQVDNGSIQTYDGKPIHIGLKENEEYTIKIYGNITSINSPTYEDISLGAFTEYSGWLKSIIIPNGVTSIGRNCFWREYMGEEEFTSITLPNTLESIGSYCFNGCESIHSITIPSSVTYIGEFAFADTGGSQDGNGCDLDIHFENPNPYVLNEEAKGMTRECYCFEGMDRVTICVPVGSMADYMDFFEGSECDSFYLYYEEGQPRPEQIPFPEEQ